MTQLVHFDAAAVLAKQLGVSARTVYRARKRILLRRDEVEKLATQRRAK